MSDQPKAPAFGQEAGQPSGKPSQQAETPGAGQPQYVTIDEARRLVEEAEEKAFRRAQGLVDKSRAGIDKTINERLKNLSASLKLQRETGIQITPEQEAALKQRVIAETYEGYEPDPAPSAAPQPGEREEAREQDPITQIAFRKLQQAGIEFDPKHPAAAKVIQASMVGSSPEEYLKAYDEYIAAVKGSPQPPQPTTNQPQQPARTPTNMGASGGPTDARTQYEAEVAVAMKEHGPGSHQVLSIRQKYRKLLGGNL